MKALVYLGDGKKTLTDRNKPSLMAPTDAIVKILKTTICGSDLHIINGDITTCTPGRILGHEGIGIISEVGSAVTRLKPGDKVLISCITSCGKCRFCRKLLFSRCIHGGWLLGNKIDGTQAEYVRIPLADTSLYPISQEIDEDSLVMLSDILPTGFEYGALNGKIQSGSSVAIIGSGPVGLAALLTAQFYSPAQVIVIDIDGNRLDIAKLFGATHTIDSRTENIIQTVMKLTENHGVDTAIEAVGIPATAELCQYMIKPGGAIANMGIHGLKVDMHLEDLWDRNITTTTRLVNTANNPLLISMLRAQKINPKLMITHHFALGNIVEAYDTFANPLNSHAIKTIIKA